VFGVPPTTAVPSSRRSRASAPVPTSEPTRGVTPLVRSGTLPLVGSRDPDVVEAYHVGPVDLGAPVVGLRDEPVADLAVALGLDVVLHGAALAVNLPRSVMSAASAETKRKFTVSVRGTRPAGT
jgi:hypothetical protein